ncbi:YihY/virulence factor BrkB family protein [Nocardioides sambongensis]|uniref:YihY/virulence factor BrkB family protein n=1 Tax=Nocardioides sambongensis TaxID=2589074 RepID=UPI00112672F4|nr:YihY/virulence factor BrkB family protein [Nocardioides sambongensis]
MTTTDSTPDNASAKKQSKLQLRLLRARRERPLLDHVLDTVEHFSAAKGSIQAGGITYFGFISFFPILALAFALVGFLAKIYPDAEADLISAINAVFPRLVGNDEGQISLDTIRDSAPGILSVGLLLVLYSGLGWLSSTRTALLVMFEMPEREQPNFVFGKLRDLVALVTLGVILLLSVSFSGVVRGLSEQILELVDLGDQLSWLLAVLAVLLGLVANMLLFFALFRVLAQPEIPAKALWSGALVGGVAFEILKQISQWLLAATADSPAFQAFGIALILVVWINYFARVVLYAASWAYTSPIAIAARPAAPAVLYGPPSPRFRRPEKSAGERSWVTPFAAGGAAMLALVAVVRRRR